MPDQYIEPMKPLEEHGCTSKAEEWRLRKLEEKFRSASLGGDLPGDHNGVKAAAVAELLAAAQEHIDSHEDEAKANLSWSNAEANFSNSEPEADAAFEAGIRASKATKRLQAAIDAARNAGVAPASSVASGTRNEGGK